MSSVSSFGLDSRLDLPSYSPSDPAPLYSFEPACDEQRLQLTPRTSANRSPTGTFIKKTGKATILLTEQQDGSESPTYGRHGPICGSLLLEESESITEVVAKVEGRFDTTISEGGGRTINLINDRYVLWSKGTSQTSSCPSQLAFAFILPPTFRDVDGSKPLPPSHNIFSTGVSTLYLKTAYNIRITVTRLAHQRLGGLWTRTKQILIPFNYIPRTRAHRPILSTPFFFSSIKTSPEEWYQAISTVQTRETSLLNPLTSHLFLPAGRVYGMRDTIPFHIQLAGRPSSLRELFSASALDRVISTDSQDTTSSRREVPSGKKPVIRVYLLRQVTVFIREQKSFRNIVIGEGTLTSVPPLLSTGYYPTSDTREEHLDWEGELRCDDSVTAGGFILSNAYIKEFVVLQIAPPPGVKSQLRDLQVSVPIRIVTDSWDDVSNMDSISP